MKVRLFCNHCDKHFEVNVNKIRLMQKLNNEHITYANNTYYYHEGCFFKKINQLEQENNIMENISNG